MAKIIGISGSLRRGSFNAALLRAAVELAPSGTTIEIGSIRDIPRIFRGRPVAITGTSPGRFGTVQSQTAWLPVVRTLGMRPWFGSVRYVAEANKVFDASGRLIDPAIREKLTGFIHGFAQFIAAGAT